MPVKGIFKPLEQTLYQSETEREIANTNASAFYQKTKWRQHRYKALNRIKEGKKVSQAIRQYYQITDDDLPSSVI